MTDGIGRHRPDLRRCDSCGAVFCLACEGSNGSNGGEPYLCERCFHVHVPRMEAA